ncbi:hypothetical protein [Streptomyces sp. NPDC101115]|uniref:hypothetical protein n=1 Tax=Streptomyces sp. NPDC101115 TaxID=3366106 RepID=UPI003809652B
MTARVEVRPECEAGEHRWCKTGEVRTCYGEVVAGLSRYCACPCHRPKEGPRAS